MRILSKIFKIICNILSFIIGIILIIALYAWMQVNMFDNEYASIFGYTVFDVVSGSMSGTIEINDYVIVKNTQDIELNDIITFRQEDSIVTHRVVQIMGNRLITRGDANNSDDVSIPLDAVIGRVDFIIPKAGIWKDVIMEPKILLMIFVTLILFTIFFSVEEKKYAKVTHKANIASLTENNKKKKVVKANLEMLRDEKKETNNKS